MPDQLSSVFRDLGWAEADPRALHVKHYLERVQSAGVNLVSDDDRNRLIERHLIPSLEALDWIPKVARVLDIGSGGGFPAIPIALARPDVCITLVEAISRKTAFLLRVSRETDLLNTVVINSRSTDLDERYDGQFDLVTARSVAGLTTLIRTTRRFLNSRGKWLFWKGEEWREEADLQGLNIILENERVLSDGGRLLLMSPKGNPTTEGGV